MQHVGEHSQALFGCGVIDVLGQEIVEIIALGPILRLQDLHQTKIGIHSCQLIHTTGAGDGIDPNSDRPGNDSDHDCGSGLGEGLGGSVPDSITA